MSESRSRTYGAFDARDMREAFTFPGSDPREWICWGVVDADGEDPDDKNVTFDPDYGPLVNLTLHPGGKRVRARVASHVAGNGEGEWYPFIEKDEVLVALANGSERNAVIIGRLNQSIDAFPTLVGGADVTKNTVSFRRSVPPRIEEVGTSYFLTSVSTGASLLVDKGGNWYVTDGAGSVMHVGADWLGLMTKLGDNVMQLQIKSGEERFYVHVGGGAASLALSASGISALLVPDALNIGTSGNSPFWHATSTESVCAILDALGKNLGTLISALGPAPLTGVVLGPIFTALGQTSLVAALPTVGPLALLGPAIQTALAVPAVPNVTPAAALPGVGCPGLVIG